MGRRTASDHSFGGRLVGAVISAMAGALLGLLGAFVAGLALDRPPTFVAIALLSALYFGVIGLVRGPDAGFVAGDVLRVIWAGVQAEVGGPARAEREEGRDQPRAWRSTGLLLVWVAGVLVVALRE